MVAVLLFVALLVGYHLWRPETDIEMTDVQTNTSPGTLMIVSFRLKNIGWINLKDPVIACDMNGASGTTIKTETKILYQSLHPGAALTFSNIPMGEVVDQATAFNCYLKHASVDWSNP